MTQTRISLWSGPRCLSTALMYAFAQRQDTEVVDEPLYGHYLARTGALHPGREEVLARVDTVAERVIAEQILGPAKRPVRFLKDMAHHLVGLDLAFLNQLQHVILIRNPHEVLPSLQRHLPQFQLLDTAYKMQYDLFMHLYQQGLRPFVIDAYDLRTAPEGVLKALCQHLGLSFDRAMLHWEPGALAEEGVWGKYWYDQVHHSDGFLPPRPGSSSVSEELVPLLETCYDYYQYLYEHSFRPVANPALVSA